MRTQRFGALVADGRDGRAIVVVPFDPDEAWGAKAVHHVNGTVNGTRVRVTLSPGERRIVSLALSPRALSYVDEQGAWRPLTGDVDLAVGGGQPDRGGRYTDDARGLTAPVRLGN